MRRSYISPEYQTKSVYGTLNMLEESTFFGAKMLEIEDSININNLDIIYYQTLNNEQLDISIESSLKSYVYSSSLDKQNNHTLVIDPSQPKYQLDNNTKWLLTIDLKSIISNQKVGNIKCSKLRFIKKSKNKKICKIEKNICTADSFCTSVLGEKLNIVPNLNYKEDCKKVYIIQYNKLTDTFLLLRRIPIKPITFKNPNKIISIDPGENTLITGISENHIIEIGTKIKHKISKHLDKINKIKKYKGTKKEKILPNGDIITENIITEKLKRQIKKIQTKIDNYVIDTHWKVANYLTLNYDHILIGNLSTSNMKKQQKVNNLDILKNLNMYKLRERIKYKCLIRNKKYLKVNEAYTTKCCINCGHVNDIGISREYECLNCKKKYGRDIKAAGCIYLKALV